MSGPCKQPQPQPHEVAFFQWQMPKCDYDPSSTRFDGKFLEVFMNVRDPVGRGWIAHVTLNNGQRIIVKERPHPRPQPPSQRTAP